MNYFASYLIFGTGRFFIADPVLAHAFECYAISHATYKSIYNYLSIPAVKTLQRITLVYLNWMIQLFF